MIQEEHKARQLAAKQESIRLAELRQNKVDELTKSAARNRLNELVGRAGIYSSWLAGKLEVRQKDLSKIRLEAHQNQSTNNDREIVDNESDQENIPLSKRKGKGNVTPFDEKPAKMIKRNVYS